MEIIIKNRGLPHLKFQHRERYLPTSFDESLTILEKINKIIHWLNENNELTEEMLVKWNEVYRWVMNEGLDNSIGERLNEWLNDGTFYTIINNDIFGELNSDIKRIDKGLLELNKSFNEGFEHFINQMDNAISDFELWLNKEKENFLKIIVSESEPESDGENIYWYKVRLI